MDLASSLVFAHLSDPHLSSLRDVNKRDLLNKRLLGYLSWRAGRRREHLSHILAALVRDLDRTQPEHVTVTGDLTHIGLPHEFTEVSHWLRALGSGSRITIIPGNHDAYARAPWNRTFALWMPYMASDEQLTTLLPPRTNGSSPFPSLRIRGLVALIGLSTAHPTPPFFATGSLGTDQLLALEHLLEETGRRGLFRTVLVHHPPLPRSEKWRKRLLDSPALCEILQRRGVELVLHGHSHRPSFAQLDTLSGIAPVIGVPSASAIGHKPKRRAQYNLYRLSRTADGWSLHISVRGFAPAEGRFVAVEERAITLPRGHLPQRGANPLDAASATQSPR